MPDRIIRKRELHNRARGLRKQATPAERKLWYQFLSGHSIRFQRQKVIGCYNVDFYCHVAKIVIELDGSQHYEENAIAYVEYRSRYLQQSGLTVLRFTNLEIMDRFESVCQAIEKHVSGAVG